MKGQEEKVNDEQKIKASMKKKQELTLNQQIDYLRGFGEDWPLTKSAAVCLAISIASMGVFIASDNEKLNVLLLFIAGVCGLVAFAILSQLPQLRRAARATRTGRRVKGVLDLTVDRSDSENLILEGELREGATTWRLSFGRPIGWTPQSGEWPCELIMLAGESIPALVELDQGLLIPSGKSHKVVPGRT